MIVVHCPRCGSSDWKWEQEYIRDLFLWVYKCLHCGEIMMPDVYRQMAKETTSDNTSALIKSTLDDMADDVVKHLRDARIAGMFDGEDSQ